MYGNYRPMRPMRPMRPFRPYRPYGFGFPFVLGLTTGALVNPYYPYYYYY